MDFLARKKPIYSWLSKLFTPESQFGLLLIIVLTVWGLSGVADTRQEDIVDSIIGSGNPRRMHLLQQFGDLDNVTNSQISRLIDFGINKQINGEGRFVPVVATAIAKQAVKKTYSFSKDSDFIQQLKRFAYALGENSHNRMMMFDLFVRQKLFTKSDFAIVSNFIINVKDPMSLNRLNDLYPFLRAELDSVTEQELAFLDSKLKNHPVKSLSALILRYRIGVRDPEFMKEILLFMVNDFAKSIVSESSFEHPAVRSGEFDQIMGELNWHAQSKTELGESLIKAIKSHRKTALKREDSEINQTKIILLNKMLAGDFVGLMDSPYEVEPTQKSNNTKTSCEMIFF
jgi:hypothetical protein